MRHLLSGCLRITLTVCADPETDTSPLQGVCHLSLGIQRALREFLSVLDDMTIADIMVNRGIVLNRFAPQPLGAQ